MSELHEWIDETAQGPCAHLLRRFVAPVSELDPEVQADVGAFGVRFRIPQGVLCELSVFGELFIVRVGGQGSVEYRVRDEPIALQAFDHLLKQYVDLKEQIKVPRPAVVPPMLHTGTREST